MVFDCCSCTLCYQIAGAFILIYLTMYLLKPSVRRSSKLPSVSATRTYERGTGADIPCINPRTGEQFATRKVYTKDDVKAAFERSSIAQQEWEKTSFDERRAVLQDVADYVLENQKEIINMSVKETGKTVTEASLGEVFTVLEKIRWTIAEGEKHLKSESRPVAFLLSFTKQARIEYHPVGVVGLIVPWNYPYNNVISHVITAIFAGNGALCKTSEVASYSAEILEDIFRLILSKRGHNPDLVQVITGYGETGATLVQSGVGTVLFIGSPQVGKLVMKGASSTLTPVTLELGGKDPFVVFDDCEYEQMLETAFLGCFVNCGQNCISAERIYVQAGIYDRFVNDVSNRMKLFRLPENKESNDNNPTDVGSLTLDLQINIVQNLINDAKDKGCRIISGGKLINNHGKGLLYEPTVLADVTHDMNIANHETFGPCMTIIKFNDEKELITMVNSTPYALGSSIFTKDYNKAERVGKQIRAGMLNINDFASVPLIHSLPFGGCGDSGFGSFNGKEGLRSFSRVKSIVTDRLPIRTKLPGFLQYPQHQNSHLIVQEANKMVYGKTWYSSIVALFNLLRLIMTPKK